MYKRTKVEIYLDNWEREVLLDFFKYCKSFSRTSQLANFLLWRKGSDQRVNYKIISRWLRRIDPIMTEIILGQKKEERRKWREQRKKQREEYDLKDLIIIGRKR